MQAARPHYEAPHLYWSVYSVSADGIITTASGPGLACTGETDYVGASFWRTFQDNAPILQAGARAMGGAHIHALVEVNDVPMEIRCGPDGAGGFIGCALYHPEIAPAPETVEQMTDIGSDARVYAVSGDLTEDPRNAPLLEHGVRSGDKILVRPGAGRAYVLLRPLTRDVGPVLDANPCCHLTRGPDAVTLAPPDPRLRPPVLRLHR
jgi:hypothetical protein